MSDNNTYSGGSTIGAIATIFLWILSKFALTDVAAFVAVIAGLSTLGVNIQRFISNRKK